MLYINEKKIFNLLDNPKIQDIEAILEKSKNLLRLLLPETAALLSCEEPRLVKKILDTASYVKEKIYGKRVVLFAPLYSNNFCKNDCIYCAFRSGNTLLKRKALNQPEIKEQVECLLSRGHKRILLVAGEAPPSSGQAPPENESLIDYYVESIKTIYSASWHGHKIKRVNINCAPLAIEKFKKLKAAGIGTYQIFQETYHEETYKKVHRSGPKSDPDKRLEAIDNAFKAGIDDVGVGALFGLYDYKFEVLAMLMHINHLEEEFNVGPHTISVPRLEPALGSSFSINSKSKVSDADFKKLVAVLRLSVPYTGIILSTRETASMRDELINLGVSQISAGSKTSPGGYKEQTEKEGGQFELSDQRSLDEIVDSLIKHGLIPSFCAACYRKERTGESFMGLAKPGEIKNMCEINALITLKEYLDDFAPDKTKEDGYNLIKKESQLLNKGSKAALDKFFKKIDEGLRDQYV